MSSSRYLVATTYAVRASEWDGSSAVIHDHSGRSGGVTLSQCCPASSVTWTSPSSLAAHKSPTCTGDSVSADSVQYVSAPVMSFVIAPPDPTSLSGSFLVRSGLIGSQLAPPVSVRKT